MTGQTPPDDRRAYRVWMHDIAADPPPHTTAVTDIALVVREGEHVVILGPSGAGKSTLLAMLALLAPVAHGTYLLDNDNTATWGSRRRATTRRRKIGFVQREAGLADERSAEDNVAAGLAYVGLRGATRRTAARAALQRVGLGDQAQQLVGDLSAEQRQRVAVARALVNQPSLLVCDEPTGHLDRAGTQQLLQVLAGLAGDGLSLVRATHDPDLAAGAERVLRMADGRLDNASAVGPEATPGNAATATPDVTPDHAATATPDVTPDNAATATPQATPVGEADAAGHALPAGDAPPALPRPRRHRVGLTIVAEAVASLAQHLARSVAMMVATAVGATGLVASLGLIATAANQIDHAFDIQATQLVIEDTAPAGTAVSFGPDAADLVASLNGVTAAGLAVPAPSGTIVGLPTTPTLLPLPVYGATPGYLDALVTTWSHGAGLTGFAYESALPVVVLGAQAAAHLGVSRIGAAIRIDGFDYEVAGIFDDTVARRDSLEAVFMPWTTLQSRYGDAAQDRPAVMVIRTVPGATEQLGLDAPLALRPDAPDLFVVGEPPEPPRLPSVIAEPTRTWLVAGASLLLVGAAGLTAYTMVTYLAAHRADLRWRRILGASGPQLGTHVLVQTGLAATLGGLVGAALGTIVVAGTAAWRHWVLVLDWSTIAAGPLAGLAVGLVGGLAPAINAARTAPV